MPFIINKEEALKFISAIVPQGKLFEIQMDSGGATSVGLFGNPEQAVDELMKQECDNASVGITINELSDNYCEATPQGHFVSTASKATDADVVGLNWIYIKCTSSSSSGGELGYKQSRAVMSKIAVNLAHNGFDRPILLTTGREMCGLVKIKFAKTQGANEVISDFLKSLSDIFSTSEVQVDLDAYKPSMTIPLGGIARSEKDRMARILWMPPVQNPASGDTLKGVVKAMQGELIEPADYNKYAPGNFDLGHWLSEHNIQYNVDTMEDGLKYTLAVCPWDPKDRSSSTVIFHRNNGKVLLRCMNAKYSNMRWSDFRRLVAPTPEERRQAQEHESIYHSYARNNLDNYNDTLECAVPPILSPLQILNKNEPEQSYIKTGIKEIDYSAMGMLRSGISLWTGLRGGGKSSVLSQVAINAVNDGNNVLIYSGEMGGKRVLSTTVRQVVGRPYCNPTEYENYFTVDDDIKRMACEWLEGKLWIYNNEYDSNARKMLETFEGFMRSRKLDLLILDNLMTLDLINISNEKWMENQQNRAETELMKQLKRLAQKYCCHVALVAHPRKLAFKGLIRLSDVAGTSNLGNLVDEAFIVHRITQDFANDAPVTFGIAKDDPIFESSNVIEIAKDRDNGSQDKLVPLFFEKETKRFKNYKEENIIYPWNADNRAKPRESTVQHYYNQSNAAKPMGANEGMNNRVEKKTEEYEQMSLEQVDKSAETMFRNEKGRSPFSTPSTPSENRLARALDAFLKRTKGENQTEALKRWQAACDGKWANTMTEEEWHVLETLK